MSNTPSPPPFCCGEGYALSTQGPLRKGAEEEDSGLWGGKVGKKKKEEEITNTKGKCKGNHCTSPRPSSGLCCSRLCLSWAVCGCGCPWCGRAGWGSRNVLEAVEGGEKGSTSHGGAPSLGTACKIRGGTTQAVLGLGIFAAPIRAALGWMTSSERVPPTWDDCRRDCMGRRPMVLRHILLDPFGNGKRQKTLSYDLLGTRTLVGSETKSCTCATDVFGPRLKCLHPQPRNICPKGRGKDAASLSRLELAHIVIARKELYARLVNEIFFSSKTQHAMERKKGGVHFCILSIAPLLWGERESTWKCFLQWAWRFLPG